MPEPITPIAPVETPIVPVVESPDVDAEEWDTVTKDLFPQLEEKKEEIKPEEGKVDDKKEDLPIDPAPPVDPAKPVEPPVVTPPAEEPSEVTPSPVAEARATQRQMEEEFNKVKNDVAQDIYKDLPIELKDSDGDPIRSVEDVMKLIDSRTKTAENPEGKPFTEEAAVAWFNYHQGELQKSITNADEEANRITNVNITLKDESDKIQKEFATVLKENPETVKKIWDTYAKTLKVSASGKVVLSAPVSLYEFMSNSLTPYVDAAKVKADALAESEAAKKLADEASRKQDRHSRSDIFGPGKTDNMSEDEKEWDEAARNVYGKN